ncbi:MAG: zf-HC2 domain-containing protein [Candidatus Krumholzibacteria bacterium]|nr:zf-HC2 domain-containing protein [Candidatus Krumholzibacteria bacterium]
MSDRCAETRERLEAMPHADLPAEDAIRVEEHLARCPACREYRDALLEDDRLLDGMTRSMDERISRMEERVMESIDTGKDRPARSAGGRVWRIALAAAAALAVIAGYNLVFRDAPGDVVWARVIEQVAKAQDYICRIDRTATPWDSYEMTAYFSKEYGQKKAIYMDGKLAAEIFVRPGDETIHLLHHKDEAYVTIGVTSEDARKLTDLTSAQELVDFFRSFEYREIGTREVDGARASGIEVSDPAIFAANYEKGTVRLWVDASTLWPVLIEREFEADSGRVRVTEIMHDFAWNPALSKKDFEFEVPEGYGTLDFGKALAGEEGALAGLRAYAELSGGRYPSAPAFDTAASEIREDRDRLMKEGRWGPDAIKQLFRYRDFSSFYQDLIENGVEVEYHGDSVRALDYGEVLMRWKLEDGRWRVIYGDLRIETVK